MLGPTFEKYVIFEGFSQNALQFRIQSEKLFISTSDRILTLCWNIYNVEDSNFKNSLNMRSSGVGIVKKRFFMVEICLEHIPKLSSIGKSMANCLKN